MTTRSILTLTVRNRSTLLSKSFIELPPPSYRAFHSSESYQDSNQIIRIDHKDWLAPNEVLKIFTPLKDPETVVDVLDKVSKRKDYKPNVALYTLVINKLAQAKKFDAIDDVMKRIKLEKTCRLSDDFFYCVIKIYGNVGGRINSAIKTLFDMPNYNCWPTVKTFNFVLNLLVSTRQFDIVHEVFMGASKLGVEIDACSLNILIKGLCVSGKLEAAFKVFDEFPKQGCRPTVLTFSTLMHGLCERGRLDEAFELLDTMERKEIYPDTITFNILISGLRKQGRVEEGIELLERMKLKGCSPNPGSYQQVLYGLLDAGRYTEAKEFMNKMIGMDVRPSFESYRLIIKGLCNESLLEDVCWVLKQMVRQGNIPRMGMWRQILHCVFSRNGNHSCISYGDIFEN